MVAVIYGIALVVNFILDVLKINSNYFPRNEDFKDSNSLVNFYPRQAHE